MKYVLAALLIFAISGCLSSQGKVGDPPSTAGAASFYAALVTYVESDECQTTDEFLKTAAKASKMRQIVLGPDWDAAFAEMLKTNQDLTPEIRGEIREKLKGLK